MYIGEASSTDINLVIADIKLKGINNIVYNCADQAANNCTMNFTTKDIFFTTPPPPQTISTIGENGDSEEILIENKYYSTKHSYYHFDGSTLVNNHIWISTYNEDLPISTVSLQKNVGIEVEEIVCTNENGLTESITYNKITNDPESVFIEVNIAGIPVFGDIDKRTNYKTTGGWDRLIYFSAEGIGTFQRQYPQDGISQGGCTNHIYQIK